MARNKSPKYQRQRRGGEKDLAFVELNGNRFYLGKYGTDESKREYRRFVIEWMSRDGLPCADDRDITVLELVSAFWGHPKRHYHRADRSSTRERANYRSVLRLLKKLYGHTLVSDFTPLALKALHEQMISKGWSRKSINRQVGRIRTVFKWGVSETLVPVNVHSDLCTVTGLQQVRTEAQESDPIGPVSEETVAAVLPKVSPIVADLIRIQLLADMRPGEVCMMRPVYLTMTGDVWTYAPPHHKTSHRGKARLIHIGPKVQAIVKRYLLNCRIDAYLFSPVESEALRRAAVHARRKTPMGCGNRPRTNHRSRPKYRPRNRYDTSTYAQTIRDGCAKAWPVPKGLNDDAIKLWRREHRWSPNQLQKATATKVRSEGGGSSSRALYSGTVPLP